MVDDEVYEVVCDCLVKACDLERDEIEPDKTLVHDLDIDSIDMLEIVFEMERTFAISIKFGELESYAREVTDGPFEIDSVITEQGLETLKDLMPEIPREKFSPGMSVEAIPMLMTVGSLCRIAEHKLAQK